MDKVNDRIAECIRILKQKTSDYSQADIPLCEELLQLANKHNDHYGEAFAHMKCAEIYQKMQLHEEYTTHVHKANEIAQAYNYNDIQMRFYNHEGIRYMYNYDEIHALSMYTKGMNIAKLEQNMHFCAMFYNNIAEIFYENHHYEKAVLYYTKAYSLLDFAKDKKTYHRTILDNLCRSYCFLNDVEHAKQYIMQSRKFMCNDEMSFINHEEVEIRICILKNEYKEALQRLLLLYEKIKLSHMNENALIPLYLFLCEMFLDFKMQDHVIWCIEKVESLNAKMNPHYTIAFQKMKIKYDQLFHIKDSSNYATFYESTHQFESMNQQVIANSLNSTISLYEAEKEKNKMQHERINLEELVMYDDLTNIYNRRCFEQIVNTYVHKKNIVSLTYIMIDVDCFKEYNDYYGHHKGDEVLRCIGNHLKKAMPKQGFPSRFGGDEFACLLVNKSLHELTNILQSIQNALLENNIEHRKSKYEKRLTLSMGAYYTEDLEHITQAILVKRADDALYQVKEQGRNGYVVLENATV